MLLNGKETTTLYRAEYIGFERRINVLRTGSFSNGNYIDLGTTPAGGEGQVRFLMRGTDEAHCWEGFARLVQAIRKSVLSIDGLNYSVVANGGEMVYVGIDRMQGGVFGIATIPVLIAACYSDKKTAFGKFIVGGAVEPYIRLSLTNAKPGEATVTVNGFKSPFVVGPLLAGKTIVIDGMKKSVTVDGINRIGLHKGFEFPRLDPGAIANITTSPAGSVTQMIEYWERWY